MLNYYWNKKSIKFTPLISWVCRICFFFKITDQQDTCTPPLHYRHSGTFEGECASVGQDLLGLLFVHLVNICLKFACRCEFMPICMKSFFTFLKNSFWRLEHPFWAFENRLKSYIQTFVCEIIYYRDHHSPLLTLINFSCSYFSSAKKVKQLQSGWLKLELQV